jgi:RNA polymerase sigma-70 factor (ECF subfamily)
MAAEGATSVIVEPGDDTSMSVEAALRRGEHGAALTLCVREHGASIGRLCMALVGSQADAEDLTQETLLAAHDAFDSWREGSIRSNI